MISVGFKRVGKNVRVSDPLTVVFRGTKVTSICMRISAGRRGYPATVKLFHVLCNAVARFSYEAWDTRTGAAHVSLSRPLGPMANLRLLFKRA